MVTWNTQRKTKPNSRYAKLRLLVSFICEIGIAIRCCAKQIQKNYRVRSGECCFSPLPDDELDGLPPRWVTTEMGYYSEGHPLRRVATEKGLPIPFFVRKNTRRSYTKQDVKNWGQILMC